MYYIDEFIEFSKEVIELKKDYLELEKEARKIKEELRITREAIERMGLNAHIEATIGEIQKEIDDIPF